MAPGHVGHYLKSLISSGMGRSMCLLNSTMPWDLYQQTVVQSHVHPLAYRYTEFVFNVYDSYKGDQGKISKNRSIRLVEINPIFLGS